MIRSERLPSKVLKTKVLSLANGKGSLDGGRKKIPLRNVWKVQSPLYVHLQIPLGWTRHDLFHFFLFSPHVANQALLPTSTPHHVNYGLAQPNYLHYYQFPSCCILCPATSPWLMPARQMKDFASTTTGPLFYMHTKDVWPSCWCSRVAVSSDHKRVRKISPEAPNKYGICSQNRKCQFSLERLLKQEEEKKIKTRSGQKESIGYMYPPWYLGSIWPTPRTINAYPNSSWKAIKTELQRPRCEQRTSRKRFESDSKSYIAEGLCWWCGSDTKYQSVSIVAASLMSRCVSNSISDLFLSLPCNLEDNKG